MNSRETENLYADLSAYLDDELSAERREQVDALLARSASARGLLEDLRHISRGLAELPRASAPAGIAEQVLQRATGLSLADDLRARRRLLWVQVASRAVASAAVVMLCVVGGWVLLVKSAVRTQPDAVVGTSESARSNIVTGRRAAPDSGEGRRVAGRGGAGSEREARPRMERDSAENRVAMNQPAKRPAGPATVSGARGAETLKELTAMGYAESGAPSASVTNLGASGPRAGAAGELVAAAPPVDIVVQAIGDDEYAELNRVVQSYEAASVVAYHVASVRSETTSAANPAILQIPEARLGEFLGALEEHAPGQVQVSMQFHSGELGAVQRMLAQNDQALSPAFDSDASLAERTGNSAAEQASPDSAPLAFAKKSEGDARLKDESEARNARLLYLPRVPPRRFTPPPAAAPPAERRPDASDARSGGADRSAGALGAAPENRTRAEEKHPVESDPRALVTDEMLKVGRDAKRIIEEKRPVVAGVEPPPGALETSSRTIADKELAKAASADTSVREGADSSTFLGAPLNPDESRSVWSGVLRRAGRLAEPVLREIETLGKSLARVPTAMEAAQSGPPMTLRVQVLPPVKESTVQPTSRP